MKKKMPWQLIVVYIIMAYQILSVIPTISLSVAYMSAVTETANRLLFQSIIYAFLVDAIYVLISPIFLLISHKQKKLKILQIFLSIFTVIAMITINIRFLVRVIIVFMLLMSPAVGEYINGSKENISEGGFIVAEGENGLEYRAYDEIDNRVENGLEGEKPPKIPFYKRVYFLIPAIIFIFMFISAVNDYNIAAGSDAFILGLHSVTSALLMLSLGMRIKNPRNAAISMPCAALCFLGAMFNVGGVWVSAMSIYIFYIGALMLVGHIIYGIIIGISNILRGKRRKQNI